MINVSDRSPFLLRTIRSLRKAFRIRTLRVSVYYVLSLVTLFLQDKYFIHDVVIVIWYFIFWRLTTSCIFAFPCVYVYYWKMLKLNYIVLTTRVGRPTSDRRDTPFKCQINVIRPCDNLFKTSVEEHWVAR